MDAKSIRLLAEAWQEVTEKKKRLDPVDKDELKGKHVDRDDKDIDNDGDVDSSDQYLHKKRKAISKSMDESEDEMTPCDKCDGSTDNHDPDCPHAESSEKKKAAQETKEDLDAKEVGKALSHDCAKHVASESWGYGECISGQHTIAESADGEGVVTHYDVMFEHGIEMDVPVENLTVLVSEKHLHAAKTKKEEVEEVEEVKKGLYHNINMKKKRGEKPNPPGHPDRPSADDFKKAAKTAKESVDLEEAKSKGFIGQSDGSSWAVNISSIKGGNQPRNMGWQMDNNRIITDFKKDAKKTRVGAKGKATIPAVKKELKLLGATEYFAKWKSDSSSYKDDSVEIWYKSSAMESVEEGTVAELNQEVETNYVGKGKSMYDAIQQVWEAAAQAKQGVAGKHQEKQKGDPQRHGQSQQMIADNDYDSPEVAADFKVGTDDVSKAGRVVSKQSPARGGADQLNVGDKKPVKGAK